MPEQQNRARYLILCPLIRGAQSTYFVRQLLRDWIGRANSAYPVPEGFSNLTNLCRNLCRGKQFPRRTRYCGNDVGERLGDSGGSNGGTEARATRTELQHLDSHQFEGSCRFREEFMLCLAKVWNEL